MNAYEALNRIDLLKQYQSALNKAYDKFSNYNEEFGEGSITALIFKEIRDDFFRQQKEIEDKLKDVNI